jgi:hypothetical protein
MFYTCYSNILYTYYTSNISVIYMYHINVMYVLYRCYKLINEFIYE